MLKISVFQTFELVGMSQLFILYQNTTWIGSNISPFNEAAFVNYFHLLSKSL